MSTKHSSYCGPSEEVAKEIIAKTSAKDKKSIFTKKKKKDGRK